MNRNVNKRVSLIIGGIIVIASILFVAILFKSISKETEIVMSDNYFEVTGIYGDKFNYKDISLVELKDTLPKVISKINGADLLETKKGYFDVTGLGKCELYILVNKGPFLYLTINHKYVIINYKNENKTEQLYKNLSEQIQSITTALAQNQSTGSQDIEENGPDSTTVTPVITPTISPTSTPSIVTEDTQYNYDLYSLDFIDEMNGWFVQWNYNDPVFYNTTSLLHTKDGGAHWESYASQDCLLQKIFFVDSNTGWALALEGHPGLTDGDHVTYQILKTEDGGRSWKLQLTQAVVYGVNYDIVAYDKKSVCVIIGGMIYRTEDGGKNWILVESPRKDFSAEHIFFADKGNGWVTGVVKSENSSEKDSSDSTTSQQAENYTVYVFLTTDGGESWTQQFSKDCGTEWNSTIGISFADNKNGWFLICNYGTFDGELYHTTNGGSDWEMIGGITVCRPYAQGVEAVTPKILWIPLHSGAGPIEGGLLYSEDSGKNFTFIGEEAGFVNSNGVEFVTPLLGWAIMNGFQDKYLMKTTNGGKTWDKVTLIDN